MIDIKELKGFQDKTYEERERMVRLMPKKSKAWLYARYCTNEQLNDIIDEWETLGKVDDMKALKKQLKKFRRVYFNTKLNGI